MRRAFLARKDFRYFRNCQSRVSLKLVFPYNEDTPAHFFEFLVVKDVTFSVSLELTCPKFGVGLRRRQCADRTPVPEASVYEDCNFQARIDDVRPTR